MPYTISSVCVVNYEHVIASWDRAHKEKKHLQKNKMHTFESADINPAPQ